jgi:hypothetical protein
LGSHVAAADAGHPDWQLALAQDLLYPNVRKKGFQVDGHQAAHFRHTVHRATFLRLRPLQLLPLVLLRGIPERPPEQRQYQHGGQQPLSSLHPISSCSGRNHPGNRTVTAGGPERQRVLIGILAKRTIHPFGFWKSARLLRAAQSAQVIARKHGIARDVRVSPAHRCIDQAHSRRHGSVMAANHSPR